MELRNAIQNRRSYYGIEKKSPIPDSAIKELVAFAVKHTPSAFNSQSQMAVLLLGDRHDQLWDIVMETLRKIVPADHFAGTEAKVNSFRSGYGTVLYFDDADITSTLQRENPLYAENFPVWAEQSNGMLQFAIWSLLEAEGLGASLQHYNPLIDEQVRAAYHLPASWRLTAQMPFGLPAAQPGEKEFSDSTDRIKIFE